MYYKPIDDKLPIFAAREKGMKRENRKNKLVKWKNHRLMYNNSAVNDKLNDEH